MFYQNTKATRKQKIIAVSEQLFALRKEYNKCSLSTVRFTAFQGKALKGLHQYLLKFSLTCRILPCPFLHLKTKMVAVVGVGEALLAKLPRWH